MSNENEKKPLSVSPRSKIELKKTTESGQVRQSFSHGRSKAVAVERKKKRSFTPSSGTFGRASESGSVDAQHDLGGVGTLTREEREHRLRALLRSEEQRKHEGDDQPSQGDGAEVMGDGAGAVSSANVTSSPDHSTSEGPLNVDAPRDHDKPALSLNIVKDTPSSDVSPAALEPGSWRGPRLSPNQGPGWTPRSVQERENRKPGAGGGRGTNQQGPRGQQQGAPRGQQGLRTSSERPASTSPTVAPESDRPVGRDAKPAPRAPTRHRDEEKEGAGRARTANADGRRRGKLTISALLSDDGSEGFRGRSVAAMRRAAQKEKRKAQAQQKGPEKIAREVIIPDAITVQELANRMAERSGLLIKSLMKMGVVATINQTIDGDTAQLVTEELGHAVRRVSDSDVEIGLETGPDAEDSLKTRAPVVTVMGHVDHGKTSLLDALRQANVASGEAGGITQHIGAYQVHMPSGKTITFIDTPGHEAFTAMRARGAKITDIVILVVAADDGIMPQTIEAIRHAHAAGVALIVAINKMDRPEANPERIRTELLQHEVVVEDMGGDVQVVEVSAKNKQNLDKLEEAILLQAELLALRANPDRLAEGTVIESKMEKGRGPVATVLISRGTLRIGDVFVAGQESGRVRAMISDTGARVEEAGPSRPVEILGLDGVPAAGDNFIVTDDEVKARNIAAYRKRREREAQAVKSARGTTMEQMVARIQSGEVKELPVVIKADVQGSIEALAGALERLGTDAIKVRILHSAVGAINESDITLANASDAMVIGFNVRANPQARKTSRRDGVDVRYYSIIYDAAEDIKRAMTGLLEPIFREKFIGYAEVREVFNITKVGKVAGCMVTEGVIKRGCRVRLLRDNVVIHEGDLSQLKRFKDDVREVRSGFDCGMSLANYGNILVGDVIECFEIEKVAAEL